MQAGRLRYRGAVVSR